MTITDYRAMVRLRGDPLPAGSGADLTIYQMVYLDRAPVCRVADLFALTEAQVEARLDRELTRRERLAIQEEPTPHTQHTPAPPAAP